MLVRVRNLKGEADENINEAFESIVEQSLSERAGSLYDAVKLLVSAWNGTAAEIGDEWQTFYTDTLDAKKKDTYKISRKTGSTASEIYGKIEKDYNFLKFLGATSGVYKSYLEPEEIRKLIQSEVLRRDYRTKPNSEEDGRT